MKTRLYPTYRAEYIKGLDFIVADRFVGVERIRHHVMNFDSAEECDAYWETI